MATALHLRAVVFDLDGVLLDSASSHRRAFEAVLQPFRVRHFDYSRYAGWRTPEVIEDVLRENATPFTPSLVRQLASEKSRLAREMLRQSNPVTPDCLSVLATLSAQYMLALASSGSRESVELFLSTNQCAPFFRAVLSGDEVARAKPDPEIYRRTFAALDIVPTQAAVIEDAVSGVTAAKATGAGAIIGLAGLSSPAQLTAAGATYVLDALQSLPALLASMQEVAASAD